MDDESREVADRLYAVPPRRFVAERDKAAAEARAAGDRTAAAAVSRLRRPTVAAWLVNLLALRRPDLVGELTELALQLREAQRQLRGEQLRELANRRRQVVAGLVAATRSLALAADPELAAAKLPLHEVEATLTAALSDPDVAATVRAGRLLRPAAAAGFGEPGGPHLRLVPGGLGQVQAPPAAGARPVDTGADAPAVRAEQEAARAAVAGAEQQVTQVGERKRAARQELAGLEQAIADLEEHLSRTRAARAGAAEQLARAEADDLAARRALAGARRRLAQAEAAAGQPEPDPGPADD